MRRPLGGTARPLSTTAPVAVIVACLLMVAGCSTTTPKPGTSGAGVFSPGPCPPSPAAAPAAVTDPSAASAGLRCGTISVPLRHEQPSGSRIALAVAVLATTAKQPDGPPVIMLAGGPGEALVEDATALAAAGPASPLAAIRAQRDLVLLDQRGVGASVPALNCTEDLAALKTLPDAAQTATITSTLVGAYRRCGARLAAGTNLSAFDTVEDAADLDSARQALGYQKVDVFATSYGTRVALEAARDDPPWLHALVLSSPLPAQADFVTDAPASFDAALHQVFATCAKTPACNAAYPDLAGHLDQGLHQLQTSPAHLQVNGADRSVTLTASDVANSLFQLLYTHPSLEAVPAIITELAAANYSAFTQNATASTGTSIAKGLQLSVLCAEQAANSSPKQLETTAHGLSTAAQLFADNNQTELPLFAICQAWPVRKAPSSILKPVHSEIPTLIVVGAYDPITPPAYGAEVANTLGHSHLVTYEQGHSPLLNQGACAIQTMLDFLNQPTRAPTDACTTDTTPAPPAP